MLTIVALFTVPIILGVRLLRWVVVFIKVQRIRKKKISIFFFSVQWKLRIANFSVLAQIKHLAVWTRQQSFRTSRYPGQALQTVFVGLYWENGAWSLQLKAFSSINLWAMLATIFPSKMSETNLWPLNKITCQFETLGNLVRTASTTCSRRVSVRRSGGFSFEVEKH